VSSPRILCYASGHGYGHSVRLAALLRELDAEVLIRTAAPAFLFDELPRARVEPGPCDIGLVQRDSLRFDLDRTLARWTEWIETWDGRVEAELELLRRFEPTLVLGDIPPLAFAVAERAGLPSVALGNFSWDWIYGAYLATHPGFEAVIAHIADQYRRASLLLRLPFHGDMSAFGRIVDIPLIALGPGRNRAIIRELLALPETAQVAIVSFGYGVAELDLGALAARYPQVIFLRLGERDSAGPANLRSVRRDRLTHSELIGCADVVLTKPGFGILSECILHGCPMLYTDRGNFREYPLLVKAARQHLPTRHVAQERLFRLDLSPELETLLAAKRPVRELPIDGAQRAKTLIEQLC